MLERVAENACGDTWRNIRDDLRQVKLAQLSSPEETIAVHRIHSELRSRRVSPAEGTGRRLGRAKFPTLH